MADSRKYLKPAERKLVQIAEANGHIVHVYRTAEPPKGGTRSVRYQLLIALDGFPRKPVGEVLDRLTTIHRAVHTARQAEKDSS